MRIAIAGKGGSGKTTIAGTMARLLGRSGRSVLAVDADTNPNLATTLGVPEAAAAAISDLPGDLLVRKEEPGCPSRTVTVLGIPVTEVIRRYAAAAPDRVNLLLMGRVEHAGAG